MLILALESSAKPASAAVFKQDGAIGKLIGQYFQNNGFSHSRTLLAMAESLMQNLGLKPSDIDLFAVANGPGSFTGVRIGVSAAKGLAFGLDAPVCGVSSLEAMAYQTAGVGTDTLICPVMDARRGQVYNALFIWDDGVLVRLRDDRAVSLEDLAVDLESFDMPHMPVGDGAGLIISGLDGRSGLHTLAPCPVFQYQSAYGVALAALHTKATAHAELKPVYLRPSQAERERQSRAASSTDEVKRYPE